jgi:hypothetical protein
VQPPRAAQSMGRKIEDLSKIFMKNCPAIPNLVINGIPDGCMYVFNGASASMAICA